MPLNAEQTARKRITQRDKILEFLETKGNNGATSEELNTIAFRYSAIIHRLRHDEGFEIETIGRKNTECTRYVLKGRFTTPQLNLVGIV